MVLCLCLSGTQALLIRSTLGPFYYPYERQRPLKKPITYPGAPLREIVLNAFCHANYYVRSNIKVEFFPSECRVTSPGEIYRATLDDLMDGIQTYRNPRLVSIFDKLVLIENFGTGIPRALEAYAPFGEKPEFKPSENFFIVHLPNLNNPARKQPADASSHDRITDRITDRKRIKGGESKGRYLTAWKWRRFPIVLHQTKLSRRR